MRIIKTLVFAVFFAATALSSIAYAEPSGNRPQDLTAYDIIREVKKKYSSIKHMKGRLKRRTVIEGRDAGSVTADFSLVWPDKVYIENLDPYEGKVVLNEKEYMMTKGDGEELFHGDISRMEPALRSGLSVDGLLMCNPVENIISGYYFIRVDDFGGSYIIKAIPKIRYIDSKISFILINVDPLNWYVKAVEVFAHDGAMFIQKRYHKFKEFRDGAFFPVLIENRMISQGQKIIEETRYSRLNNSEILDLSIFGL